MILALGLIMIFAGLVYVLISLDIAEKLLEDEDVSFLDALAAGFKWPMAVFAGRKDK